MPGLTHAMAVSIIIPRQSRCLLQSLRNSATYPKMCEHQFINNSKAEINWGTLYVCSCAYLFISIDEHVCLCGLNKAIN